MHPRAARFATPALPLAALLAAALSAGVVGLGCQQDRYPQINALQPDWLWASGRATLAIHGAHLPEAVQRAVLRGPVSQPLVHLQPVSTKLVLGTLAQGLPAGDYALDLTFAGWPPVTLPGALRVRPAPSDQQDVDGPEVWVTAPDPALGVRPGVPLEVEVHAYDPSGVRWIGYETSGRIERAEGRVVSSGGDEAHTRFMLPVPADLQPLTLFWLIPLAEDRLGNSGAAAYAASVVICGDAGDGSPVWECQN